LIRTNQLNLQPRDYSIILKIRQVEMCRHEWKNKF